MNHLDFRPDYEANRRHLLEKEVAEWRAKRARIYSLIFWAVALSAFIYFLTH